MKILVLSGSKRKNGNTAALIKQTLIPFEQAGFEIDQFFLGHMNIEGCRGCEGCAKTNKCVIQDEMQILYQKMRESDLLIAASPTYFYNMTGDMKKFIDRCYCFTSYDKTDRSSWVSEFEQGKRKLCGIITLCEQKDVADLGFTADAMGAAIGSLGYRIVFTQKALHVFKPGEVLKHEDTLEEALENGKRLLRTYRLNNPIQ